MLWKQPKLPIFIVFAIILISSSCSTKNGPESSTARPIADSEIEAYWIKFYKINSRVIVHLNGEEIHDSGVFEEITKPYPLSLSKLIKEGKNTLEIDLLNGPPYDDSVGFDKYWEIDYEIFNYDEPIDFSYEVNKTGRNGLVWEREHILEIE